MKNLKGQENIYIPLNIHKEIPLDITDLTKQYEEQVRQAFNDIPEPDKDEVYKAIKSHAELVVGDLIAELIQQITATIIEPMVKSETREAIHQAIASRKFDMDEMIDAAFEGGQVERSIQYLIDEKVIGLSKQYNIKKMMRDAVAEEVEKAQ